jgi:hypothetical protein
MNRSQFYLGKNSLARESEEKSISSQQWISNPLDRAFFLNEPIRPKQAFQSGTVDSLSCIATRTGAFVGKLKAAA